MGCLYPIRLDGFLLRVDFAVYNCDMSVLSYGYLLLDYCSVVQCDWIRV